MIKEIDIAMTPKEAVDVNSHLKIISKFSGIPENKIYSCKIIRRSIDARHKNITVNLRFLVGIEEKISGLMDSHLHYSNVKDKKEVLIIGAGPAGLFAALKLISMGLRPLIFERGKDVSGRKKDIALLYRTQQINPESNYAFGEGGAGTFSDGKIYTRSKKRGNINDVLKILHFHGADESILYDHQPHIGSDKLPMIIKKIRKTIIGYGGEFRFNSKIIDFIIEDNKITGIIDQNNEKIEGNTVILATGHSASDVYEILARHNIHTQFKPFAMGIRVEHPQELINRIRYHSKNHDYLPPASYNLIFQVKNRGVFSFCMCPGGAIIPSSTSNAEIVTNGMSSSKRHSDFANSGIVVEINQEDTKSFAGYGVFSGLMFQKSIEKTARINSGGGLIAPAQKLGDFVKRQISSSLPGNSYLPGVISSPLHSWLPENISYRLIEGLNQFEKLMKGFITNDALALAVESRTSSTVRISRNANDFQHPSIKGLFPCGEGAGYSGGIISSALDGINCAIKVSELQKIINQ